MFYLIICCLVAVLSKILFRLQALGIRNIPLKGGFILASNHVSYLDPPVLAAACPRVLSFLAKEGLFKNAAFAWLLTSVNSISINNKSGDLRSLRRSIRDLRSGKALAIFPEGGRIENGRLEKPMWGVGFLATKAVVPIIPAFIEGSDKALPVHSKFIRPKKIKIHFGRPILPEKSRSQLNRKHLYQAIAERTMKEIAWLKDKSEQSNKD